jgi:protein-disulfide isomerase
MSESTAATGLLFTSNTCSNCPPAKKEFDKLREERTDIELHELLTQSPKGQKLAKKFGIMSVPTYIFYGPGHESPMGLVGSQSVNTLNKYVDKALGKKAPKKERKGFFIKNLFKK